MAEVNLTINGRSYGISCDDGQERRVQQLGHYIDGRLKEVSRSGAASNELHLLVLTSLMIADEVVELREEVSQMSRQMHKMEGAGNGVNGPDEAAISHAVDQLASRIDAITGRLQKV
ncbi:MAG: cell division protein ZapA [Alphaproteobacteria bacterium]